ncbi:hypothetical protein ABBQ38_002178 [Trebouxia sp. C0009 RCD-2024]
MPGFHDDRTERDYETGGGYRSNRDVREARRQQGPPARGRTSAPGERRDRDPGCRVYVHNLDYGTSWQDLKDHMRGAGGQVEYVKIMQDFDGRPKGFGVCEFTSRQDAQDAIEKLDQSELQGRTIGLRADRDADGDAGRDATRRSDRRDDSSYRSRRDDTRRRDDDRSYSRRDRSPRREPYRDQHDDRHRQDDNRGDRARPHESRGGKGVEELDAEMDDLKEQRMAATQE